MSGPALLAAGLDTTAATAAFAGARPFRHCVIDGFFSDDFAQALLDEFPPFDRGDARNEDGTAGGKSVVEGIAALGPHFRQLDGLVQERAFLDLVGGITGIDGLLYDRDYFGGGTHENRDGQSLDSHVDFNYHPVTGWHRRLNLIVYLNRAWSPAWGGCLELHLDPRDPARDEVVEVAPLFNRCVIFETTERSWHGFAPIAVPRRVPEITRKSIALYFYTRERPSEETATRHSTVYVDRPLPERFAAGHTLDAADVALLRELLARRDDHARRLYRELAALQARLDQSGVGRLVDAGRRLLARLRD